MQIRRKKSELNQLWFETIEFFKLIRLVPNNYLRIIKFFILLLLNIIKKVFQFILIFILMVLTMSDIS